MTAVVINLTMHPWANPEHPSYRGLPAHRCLGCRKPCCRSAWGNWCFDCNLARMGRITAGMIEYAKACGLDDDFINEHLGVSGVGVTAAKPKRRRRIVDGLALIEQKPKRKPRRGRS